MEAMDLTLTTTTQGTTRRTCLVAGCPCKDARILSHRHAAFVAALARSRAQTADRCIAPEAGWRIPPSSDPSDQSPAAA
jgi:hypothetical protein